MPSALPRRPPEPDVVLLRMRLKYGDRLRVYGARTHATGHGYTHGHADTPSPRESTT